MLNEVDRPYKGGLSRFVTFVLMSLSVFLISIRRPFFTSHLFLKDTLCCVIRRTFYKSRGSVGHIPKNGCFGDC